VKSNELNDTASPIAVLYRFPSPSIPTPYRLQGPKWHADFRPALLVAERPKALALAQQLIDHVIYDN